LGALQLGFYDRNGRLHFAGGVGTGLSDDQLVRLRDRLDALAGNPPEALLVAGDPLDTAIRWVRPELVAEVQFVAWSGAARVRHGVYPGLREDKSAREVVLDVPDAAAERRPVSPRQASGAPSARQRPKIAVPPKRKSQRGTQAEAQIVTARAPKRATEPLGGVTLTHPERELWPGVTKHDLAGYWRAIATHALPGLVRRPLAIVRCPQGIGGQQFFQKRAHGSLPPQVRDGEAGDSPYLAIDDADGLFAMTQMSAIELHAWGANEADPLHPDQLVFDLDPGEGIAFVDVVTAAREVRERLRLLGLESFCRTTGGKGLHVVVPLEPCADWGEAKPFCHAFAETMSQDQPDRFLPTLKKVDRRGRILVDWLRNGLGATAVASFCPRARPGATVATPLAWTEVSPTLDPTAFTVLTVPQRLARLRDNAWAGFEDARRPLPDIPRVKVTASKQAATNDGGTAAPSRRPVIVFARKPKPRG
ncbi:MAG: non-homologous end-joining DNA ligase, partial [Pseudomonadota bacterium]|nr:non-homologous end-joining DNA ligase [Pseudomonadota bacterium]